MIHGPYPVFDKTQAPTISTVNGIEVATYPTRPGEHYTATPDFYAEHAATLTPYQVDPVRPLQHVMAGDDPEAAPWVTGDEGADWNTIPLRFPDAETAAEVIASILPPVEERLP